MAERHLVDLHSPELALIDHGWSGYVERHSVDAVLPSEYLRTKSAYQHAWAEGYERGVGQAVGVAEVDAARNATIRKGRELSDLRHAIVEQLNHAAVALGVPKLDPHDADTAEVQRFVALLGTRHYMATQRVTDLEALLANIAEYWNGHKEHGAMLNALEYIGTAARAAIAKAPEAVTP